MKKETVRYLWEKAANAAIALYYLYFAYIHLHAYMAEGRISSLLFVVFETVIVVVTLMRSMPKEVSISPYEWTIALTATLLTLFLRPATEMHDIPALYIVQLFGITISIMGIFSLNKSFGVVAANRGVKTSGMYRFVRHPVYAGYFLSVSAFCAQNPTRDNLIIMAISLAMQVLRIIAEENFLQRDAAYVEYMKNTRYRLLPYIW